MSESRIWRYFVKWKKASGWNYGICRHMDEKEMKKYPGKALVDDPIYPICYFVDEQALIDIIPDQGKWNPKTMDFEGGDELTQLVSASYRAAQALEESLLGKGVVAHRLFAIGVADGKAWYTITNVDRKKKTCTVEWRGYCPDRWTDHWFGWGRKNVAFADVKLYLHRADAGHKLFGRVKKATKSKATV